MSTAVRRVLDPDLAPLVDRTRQYVEAAKAPATLRAYRADWRHWQAWCVDRQLAPLPATPETVALYLTDLAATYRPVTLNRRLTVITHAHTQAGYASPASRQHPLVAETLKGIRRTHGTAPLAAKAPALTRDVRKMVAAQPDTLAGARDRCLLLLGFAGGFRRSELAALDVADLTETEEGLVVTLRRSKTDQEGQGRAVAVPYGSTPATCPVRAYRTWRNKSGITDGALFRGIDRYGRLGRRLHKDSIGLIVKRAAESAGLDPELYAGHSLRAGLATQAYLNGARELDIMRQTGHRSLNTVRRYIRNLDLWENNPAGKLGL